jgi:hypothetical protein
MRSQRHSKASRDPVDDRIALLLELLADEVAERLVRRGTILLADESPRRRKERARWRDEEMGTESSAPTMSETNGESLSLTEEVRELVVSLKQKARRAKRNVSPSETLKRSGE